MTAARVPQDLPSVDYLRACLAYDPGAGVLTWKERPREHFNSDFAYRRFNTRYAGQVAGGPDRQGYHKLRIDRTLVTAHRVVWAIVTGAWPDPGLQLDHVDLDKSNNRFTNLTLVSPGANSRRFARSRRNTSGATGVHYRHTDRRWIAKVRADGKTVTIGAYRSFEDAVTARRAADSAFGYAANHGAEQTTVVSDFQDGHTSLANSSGVTGCYFVPGRGNWRAFIYVNRLCIGLGCYDTLEQAAAARKSAEIEYGVTNRKGRGKVRLL